MIVDHCLAVLLKALVQDIAKLSLTPGFQLDISLSKGYFRGHADVVNSIVHLINVEILLHACRMHELLYTLHHVHLALDHLRISCKLLLQLNNLVIAFEVFEHRQELSVMVDELSEDVHVLAGLLAKLESCLHLFQLVAFQDLLVEALAQ